MSHLCIHKYFFSPLVSTRHDNSALTSSSNKLTSSVVIFCPESHDIFQITKFHILITKNQLCRLILSAIKYGKITHLSLYLPCCSADISVSAFIHRNQFRVAENSRYLLKGYKWLCRIRAGCQRKESVIVDEKEKPERWF